MPRFKYLDLGDGKLHRPHIERPHIAQEFRDKGAEDDSENICLKLLPHARTCARGEVSAAFKERMGA